jgi:hypothetical protein
MDTGGVKYACAGIGKVSRDDPRWKTFPVKLVFAAANGDFLGDPNSPSPTPPASTPSRPNATAPGS